MYCFCTIYFYSSFLPNFLMSEPKKRDFEELVIYKLKNRGYWGHRLMNKSDLVKGVPREYYKDMEDTAEKLFKEGLLLRKPGLRKEFRYSLNSSRKLEIEERIKNYLKKRGVDFRVV